MLAVYYVGHDHEFRGYVAFQQQLVYKIYKLVYEVGYSRCEKHMAQGKVHGPSTPDMKFDQKLFCHPLNPIMNNDESVARG